MPKQETPYPILAEIAAAMPETPFMWEHFDDLELLSREWHELLVAASSKVRSSLRHNFVNDAREELIEAALIVVSAIQAIDYHTYTCSRKTN
jgi:hypothetical protein